MTGICGRSAVKPGKYWKASRAGDKTTHSFDATLQASGGQFDGWYLGFSDQQERIERGTSKYEAHRVTLSDVI